MPRFSRFQALEEMIHMRMADDHALDMALKIRLPDQPGRRPCSQAFVSVIKIPPFATHLLFRQIPG